MDASKRFREAIDRVPALRQIGSQNAGLARALSEVKAWQAQRFPITLTWTSLLPPYILDVPTFSWMSCTVSVITVTEMLSSQKWQRQLS
jgi:hypothetical protein